MVIFMELSRDYQGIDLARLSKYNTSDLIKGWLKTIKNQRYSFHTSLLHKLDSKTSRSKNNQQNFHQYALDKGSSLMRRI